MLCATGVYLAVLKLAGNDAWFGWRAQALPLMYKRGRMNKSDSLLSNIVNIFSI